MKKSVLSIAIVAMVVSASACATITRGTTQQFVVETTPPGAAVKTTNGFTCPSTPCTFSMQRKEPFGVTVTKDGFAPQTAQIRSDLAGSGAAGLAGNVLFGGFIGIGVDATSGALNDLSPNPLQLVLEPVAPASAPASTPVAEKAAGADTVG